MRNLKIKTMLIFLMVLMISTINAREYELPKGTLQDNKDINLSIRDYDFQTYIDANNILMFVTNVGSVAEDISVMFGKQDGFYYPYNGNINDIYTTPSVLYSAGIWLGGKVNGEIRVAVGAFDTPEYWPGPTDSEGGKLPDDPSYKVYKIDASSGPGDPDYDNWPVALGAPVDEFNNPLLLGDQTFWAVYNDGGTHTYDGYGGATDSLGVEVHQTVWASDDPGEENVVYIKYLFFNNSVNIIEDFYISFWADPDLGGASDDYVGCDTTHDIFFCYNATNNDNSYGSVPPAWGAKVISGPVIPSPGDVADFNGELLPNFKNLGLSSFSAFINGTDPDVPEESYGYMMGNDSKGMHGGDPGTPPTDNEGNLTKYVYAGNPITGEGWIDSNPADRRLMASFGPMTFNPGDVQQLVLKLGAYAKVSRLVSLSKLKNILDSNCPEEPVEYVASSSLETWITNYGKLSNVYFEPYDQRWLAGVNWGGSYFNGAVDFGYNFWGGYLNPETMLEQFSNVELRFTDNPAVSGQRAYNYLRGGNPNYGYQGYYLCPFQAWDVDNNRQLNVCFVEWIDSDIYNQTWDPDATEVGGREYLNIMASDYDGDNLSDAGTGAIDYTTEDFYDGGTFDFMYSGWFRNRAEYIPIADGQQLVFDLQNRNENGLVESIQFRETAVGNNDLQDVEFNCATTSISTFEITSSNPDAFYAYPSLFDMYDGTIQMAKIYFSPDAAGDYTEHLYIIDLTSSTIMDEIILYGSAFDDWVCGDIDGQEGINVLDIVYLIMYKFKGGPEPIPVVDAGDVDGVPGINILDIVYLINYKFKGGPDLNCVGGGSLFSTRDLFETVDTAIISYVVKDGISEISIVTPTDLYGIEITIENSDGTTVKLENKCDDMSIYSSQTDNKIELCLLDINGDNFIAKGQRAIIEATGNFKITHALGADKSANPIYFKIENKTLPATFSLNQNYPNPFNPTTNISFDLPKTSFVNLNIYNLLGQKIEILISKQMEAGSYNVNWNGKDAASGIYFYRITTENFEETKKMILLK